MDLNCRVCLQVRDIMVHIFEEVDQFQTDLATLLRQCGGLTVQNDDSFPKYLCQQCTQELLIAAEFREKCQHAAKLLLDMQNTSAKAEMLTEETVEAIDTTNVPSESPLLCESEVEHSFQLRDCEIDQDSYVLDENSKGSTSKTLGPTHINLVLENGTLLSGNEELNNVIKLVVPVERYEVRTTPNFPEEVIIEEPEETTSSDHITYSNGAVVTSETSDIIEELLPSKSEQTYDDLKLLDTENPTTSTKPMENYYYDCRACGASFVKSINLRRHMEVEHNTLLKFFCKKCNKNFQVEENYRQHMNLCSKKDLEASNEVLSTLSESTKKPKHTTGKHICDYCGKRLQSAFSLKMHERTHTGERPFSCDLCQSQFKTQAALSAHKKRHTGKADFVCKVCQKRFFDCSNLTTHMRIHTGVRPHSCTVCNKSFTRVFLLLLHMRTHTGEKPFQCEHCQKSFSQSCDLKYHLTTHSNGGGKYTCSKCPKTFVRRDKFQMHMEKHAAMQISQDTADISEIEGAQNTESFIEYDPQMCLNDFNVDTGALS